MTLKRWLDPRQWPSLVVAGVTLALVILLSGMIASLGIRFMGSREAFEAARQQALPWLFLWRWACYGVLIACWLKVWKPKLLRQLSKDSEGGTLARQKLTRLERLCVCAMVFVEGYNLADWLGGV